MPPKKRAPGAALLSQPKPTVPIVLDDHEKQHRLDQVSVPLAPVLAETALPDKDPFTTFQVLQDAYAMNEAYDAWDEAHTMHEAWEEAQAGVPETEEEPVDPAELAFEAWRAAVAAMPEDEPRYVVGPRGNRRVRSKGHKLERGQIVPGAAHFTRLQSWLDAGHLEKV